MTPGGLICRNLEALSRVDWQRVALNLRHVGFTSKKLAHELGVSRSAVYQWSQGKKGPDVWTGIRLLDLHFDHCPERHSRQALMTGGRE